MNKWNAALAAALLTAVMTGCSVKFQGQDASGTDSAPQATSSPAPVISPSPSKGPSKASGAPKKEASPTPKSAAAPGVKPSPKATAPSSSPSAKPTAGSQKPVPDAKALSWYYMKKGKGIVPGFPAETKQYGPDRKVMWVGSGKKVYLTFDNGGPMGDVDKLLQVLKDNGVKANFFLAGYNIKAHPDYLKRLVADGHLVANHTMTHPDMTKVPIEQVKKELREFEDMYTDITGQPIPKYFRFPYGKYSMDLLSLVSDMGYTSVFWSTAMRDWEPRKNGADDAYNDVMNNLYNGNIILLHQGSKENIDALDRIIKGIKKEGYEIALLGS